MSSERIRLIWQLDREHSWEPGWLLLLLEKFEVEQIMDMNHEVVTERAIVVTNGETRNGTSMDEYLMRFGASGCPAGVFHLSDEACMAGLTFYGHAAFVYRNYFRADSLLLPNCRYFALGYKSGFTEGLEVRDIGRRRYRWSFAGQFKSSRALMLRAADKIPGGFTHFTNGLADPQALEVRAYADLLANSVFALCPRGNVNLDCFRLYEALEAGAIPIVEDCPVEPRQHGSVAGRVLQFARGCLKGRGRPYASGTMPRSYWEAAYGKDFPCPRIGHWRQLEKVLTDMEVRATSQRCRNWWRSYKETLANRLCKDVERSLLNGK